MTTTAATATIETLATEAEVVQEVTQTSQRRRSFGIKRSGDDSEGGFTLVEVMVVVLIIGILLAIGVPTFLGARNRAHDRAAQSGLRTAQNSALIIYTDHANFAEVTHVSLAANEPQLSWLWRTTPSTGPNRISMIGTADGSEFGAAAMSNSGTCFFIHLREDGSTQFGSSDTTACTGNSALTVTGTGW